MLLFQACILCIRRSYKDGQHENVCYRHSVTWRVRKGGWDRRNDLASQATGAFENVRRTGRQAESCDY